MYRSSTTDFQFIERDYFYLVSELNNHVLDITGSAHGGQLCTWYRKTDDQENQLWQWDNSQLCSMKEDFVADIEAENTDDGANAIAWHRHNKMNQKWHFYEGMNKKLILMALDSIKISLLHMIFIFISEF